MRKKIKWLMFMSLSVATSTLMLTAVTSCGTSWNKWDPENGGSSTYNPKKYIAVPELWKVRDEFKSMTLLEAKNIWNPTTNTLNITKINNQFELYWAIGLITKIKQENMNSIDSYWEMGPATPITDQWEKLREYITNLNDLTTININENGNPYGPISIDLTSDKKTLTDGFNNYDNSDIDATKPTGLAPFHNQRQYDVEYHGLNATKQPIDFFQVSQAGISLTQIPAVSALLTIDGTFALQLSKLVNIPKVAFGGFTNFMTSMDKFFDNFMNNQGYKNWIIDNKINMNIVLGSNGIINASPPPEFISFKGGIIVTMLK